MTADTPKIQVTLYISKYYPEMPGSVFFRYIVAWRAADRLRQAAGDRMRRGAKATALRRRWRDAEQRGERGARSAPCRIDGLVRSHFVPEHDAFGRSRCGADDAISATGPSGPVMVQFLDHRGVADRRLLFRQCRRQRRSRCDLRPASLQSRHLPQNPYRDTISDSCGACWTPWSDRVGRAAFAAAVRPFRVTLRRLLLRDLQVPAQ